MLTLAGWTKTAFVFSGQIDLYAGNTNEKETDLDIVILDQGKFVIGEARVIALIF